METFSSFAIVHETPMAFKEIQKQANPLLPLGRELPEQLGAVTGAYFSPQGGGAGDGKLFIRGYDPAHVALTINGIPVNDLENDVLLWSDWSGLEELAGKVQLQKGLNTADFSPFAAGGTVNLITQQPSDHMGISFRQQVGGNHALKSVVQANSGLIADKYRVHLALVRQTADGLIDKTWLDSWTYYGAADWRVNEDNQLKLSVIGINQEHGLNIFRQNIAVYDSAYAHSLAGYDTSSTLKRKYQERKPTFNQSWAPVDPSYSGLQSWNGQTSARHRSNYIGLSGASKNALAQLHWFWKPAGRTVLMNSFFYQHGFSGRSRPLGRIPRRDANGRLGGSSYKFYYGPSPWSFDFNEAVRINSSPSGTYYVDKRPFQKENGQSIGILGADISKRNTFGFVSKLNQQLSKSFRMTVGLDWRYSDAEHFREVHDLLGGEYYFSETNEFETDSVQRVKRLGDKIDYDYTVVTNWLNTFGRLEYVTSKFTVFASYGYFFRHFTMQNHFRKASRESDKEMQADAGKQAGRQIKTGLIYSIPSQWEFILNYTFSSVPAIFRNSISTYDSFVLHPGNDKYEAIETGLNHYFFNKTLRTSANFYYSVHANQSAYDWNTGVLFSQAKSGRTGLEVEADFNPSDVFVLTGFLYIGGWKMLNNPKQQDIHSNLTGTVEEKNIELGGQPQITWGLKAFYEPVTNLKTQISYRHYLNYHSSWYLGEQRSSVQSWKIPSFFLVDLNMEYRLPLHVSKLDFSVQASVYNLFNLRYISDAVDNSAYYGYDHDHSADDAEVFMGAPRFFNIGINVRY